jgi:phospholipase D1/2
MSDPEPARPHALVPRIVTLLLVLCLIAAALYGLFFTPYGHQLRNDREAAGAAFRAWVDTHRLIAPMILIGLYVAGGVSLFPVWWIQILSGYGFGMWLGVQYSLAGATLAAAASFLVSRLLVADWVHDKFEARHAKLRELDDKMGHNGLLIVMASRLMHFLPFGVSNYLFGITRITLPDVILGTILGNAPAIAFYVAIGAGWQPLRDWRFMSTLAVLNVVLLIPVALRYWKPHWFRRIGIE